MARLKDLRPKSGRKIAVVDDDLALLRSTVRLLEHDGHEVRSAATAPEAVELIRTWSPDLVLLDYYLADATGADVVRAVRRFDELVQVLLVTGYAAEQPARRLLAELEIQGYHDKGDGPERLLVLVDAALKHHHALTRIERQRRYLRHILDVSPQISRLQPARGVLRAALENVGALLAADDGVIVTANSGLFVFDQPDRGLSVHAATGRYAGATERNELDDVLCEVVSAGLSIDAPTADPRGFVVVPLRTRGGDRGLMVMEAPALPADAVEPCRIYANQVVQALENVILYERATTDPLTQIHNRAFGLQRLDECLRLGSRTDDPTAVVLIDVDHFKRLNDDHGHAAGDVALRAVASALRGAVRNTDVVSRHGGEEFLVVLPATDADGAQVLAERLRSAVRELSISFDGEPLRVTASLGVASAEAGAVDLESLVRRADEALYRAKGDGRDRVVLAGEEVRGALAAS